MTHHIGMFVFSVQRTCYKTLMQEVQEKEAKHQDPADLVSSQQPSATPRVSERLALLKSVFTRTRTPREVGIVDRPYRKRTPSSCLQRRSYPFGWFRRLCLLTGGERCRAAGSTDSKLRQRYRKATGILEPRRSPLPLLFLFFLYRPAA